MSLIAKALLVVMGIMVIVAVFLIFLGYMVKAHGLNYTVLLTPDKPHNLTDIVRQILDSAVRDDGLNNHNTSVLAYGQLVPNDVNTTLPNQSGGLEPALCCHQFGEGKIWGDERQK